jgi:hypothetical protein
LTEAEGIIAELRLREISDELTQLRQFLDVEPGNMLLIELLELERATIKEHFIKVVK